MSQESTQLNKKIKDFQKIYLDCYGKSISSIEAEKTLLEISHLLKEIIKINY